MYNKKAETVIMVRYLMGVAYLPFPLAKILYKFFTVVLPTSEYMLFLDVEPEESLKRLLKRNELEMFENLNDLIKVRGKALKFTEKWHIINTGNSIEHAQMEINGVLDCLDSSSSTENQAEVSEVKLL
jgi:dTMP kinase